jgi:hypothetical protein
VYTGETEALKSLGIVMTEANLKQYAMSKGIKKSITDMSQAEKVQLRYAYVMSVTADAQGDFERTGGGAANQSRMFKEQLKQLGASIGTAILPAVTDLIKSVNEILKGFQNLSPETKKTIVTIGLVAAAIGPLLMVTGKLTTAAGNIAGAFAKASKALAGGKGFVGTLKAFLSPAGLVVAAVVAITAAITALVIAISNTELAKLSADVKKLSDDIKTSKEEFDEQNKSIETNTKLAGKLTDELYALNAKEKKSNTEKARMGTLVRQLNEMYPDLNLLINKETGLLDKNEKAVRDVIAAKEEQLKFEAYEKRMKDLMEKRITAEENYAKAVEQLTGKKKDATQADIDHAIEINKNTAFGQAAIDTYKETITTLGDLDESLGLTRGEWEKMAGTVVTSNDEIIESNDDAIESNAELQEKILALTETEETHAKRSIEAGKKTIDELRANADERKKLIQDNLDQMGTATDEGIKKIELSGDQWKKNLDKQTEDYTKWISNMNTLAPKIPAKMLEELRLMGPQYSGLIAGLAEKTPEDLQPIVDSWKAHGAAAVNALSIGLNTSGTGGGGGGKSGHHSGLSGVMGGAISGVKNVISEESKTGSGTYKTAKGLGTSLMSGLQSGIYAQLNTVIRNVRKAIEQIMSAIRSVIKPGSPSKVTTVYGKSIPDGLTVGIAARAKNAIQEARSLASGLTGAFSSIGTARIPTPSYAAAGLSSSMSDSPRHSGIQDAITKALSSAPSGGKIDVHLHLDSKEIAHELVDPISQLQAAKTTAYNRGRGY